MLALMKTGKIRFNENIGYLIKFKKSKITKSFLKFLALTILYILKRFII